MEYIELTIEDALKLFRGDNSKTVLVAVKDLENEKDTLQRFEHITEYRCGGIIKKSKTICHSKDDVISHLLLFSDKQNLWDIKPIGSMTHVIYPDG